MQTINFAHLRIDPNHTLLDLGCGEGRHALGAALMTKADCILAIDIDERNIRTARHRQKEWPQLRCHFAVADGLQLPLADHSIDLVICSEVLEHLPSYPAALLEIQRILKPGGQLAISVPRAWPERICWWLSRAYHEVEGGHVHIFNAKKLREQIEALNFRFIRRHWAHALHTPYWWLRCLFWRRDEGDQVPLVRWYHKLLVWDLMRKPWLTQRLEHCLNPLIGKSIVMYFEKAIYLDAINPRANKRLDKKKDSV